MDLRLIGADALKRSAQEQAAVGEVKATELDVTEPRVAKRRSLQALAAFGGIDVLINNAGVVQSGRISEFSERNWNRVFAVNSKGIFLMVRAALPALRRSKQAARS